MRTRRRSRRWTCRRAQLRRSCAGRLSGTPTSWREPHLGGAHVSFRNRRRPAPRTDCQSDDRAAERAVPAGRSDTDTCRCARSSGATADPEQVCHEPEWRGDGTSGGVQDEVHHLKSWRIRRRQRPSPPGWPRAPGHRAQRRGAARSPWLWRDHGAPQGSPGSMLSSAMARRSAGPPVVFSTLTRSMLAWAIS